MFEFVITLFLIFVGFVALFLFALWLKDFQSELRYLTKELRRTEGEERKYWLRKRRKLWLSILPFVKY
jgi:hypothetical protein